MGSLLDLADQIEGRTSAQQIMIEDGLPPAAIVASEERSAAWKGRPTIERTITMKTEPKTSKADQVAGLRTQRAAQKGTKASKLSATTSRTRREPGSVPARGKASLPKKPNLKATTTGSNTDSKSKSAIVHRMLISATGATRRELSEASGWPSVNLKTAARRAEMKLVEDNEGRCRLVAKA